MRRRIKDGLLLLTALLFLRTNGRTQDSARMMRRAFNLRLAAKRIHEQMLLKIINPLPYVLTYEARMFLLREKRWVKTDVYPVMAGISGMETWKDIIVSLALSNWSLRKGE